MNYKYIDWTVMRGALIIVLISLIVSSSLVSGGFYFKDEMQREFNRNEALFKSISGRYLAVDEEEKLIKSYLPKFIKLYNNGVLDKERRLDWIEVLRRTGETIKLPSLNYEIKSQNIYSPPYSVNLGRYKLHSSAMSLNMQLLHEGDLFNLFEVLDENAKGTYGIRKCKLDSTTSDINLNPKAANVSAKCDLEWFIIKLADGSELQV